MKKLNAILVLAVFLAASFGIYMYVSAASSTLTGWVTNIEGTQYIPNVNVSLWNTTDDFIASNLTDSNGMFYFGQLNDTTYYINLTGSGLISRINVSLTLSAGANTQNYTIYTDNKGSYNVTVVDWWNRRPIPGATVNISWATSSHSRTTDSNGWTILEVPANSSMYPQGISHDFIVSAPGYGKNTSVTQESIMEGTNKNITIALKGSCVLSGYVVDSSRNGADNITGAVIQLRSGDNSSLLNWSNTYYYNVTTNANGHYSIRFPDAGSLTDHCNPYMYTSATGYGDRGDFWVSGAGEYNISMTGSALLSGTVADAGNRNYMISGATVSFYGQQGGIIYQATTNSNGQFSIHAKDGENRTSLNIAKTGYSTYSNSTVLNSTVNYGQINMTGGGTFSGTVVDYQNTSIKISGATVTFTPVSGGASYTNTTGSNGVFTATVSSATNYDVVVSASGYGSNSTFSNTAASGSLGTISLTGSNRVIGTISDSANLQDQYPDSVQVIANSTSFSNSYQVYGNSNGQYSVYLPTTMTSYSLYFIKSGYNTSTVSSSDLGSPTIDVAMKGATRVQGTARDAYNNKVLSGVLVEFYNPSTNVTYYQTTTDGNGDYGTDIGINFNFGVKASTTGYNDYINGTNHAWGIVHTENMNMNGSRSIHITVVDSVDGSSVSNAQVCAYYTSPSPCDYPMTTDTGGAATFSIKDDQYKLKVSKAGYITQTLPPSGYYSSDFSQTVSLSAHANVYVYDSNAVSQIPVPYADVVMYSHHNDTNFNYTLNETVLNITVHCNGSAKTGINITLRGIDVSYNQSNLTVSGESNITFYRVPSGRTNMTIDGSSVGCQYVEETITVPEGGYTYQFGTYNLSPITAVFWVVDPINSSVSGADIEMVGTPSINCTTNSSGQCTMSYVTGYTQNFSANTSTLYYRTNRSYWVDPGIGNDFTGDPFVMDPHPGNLSVLVNGSVVQGANVSIRNSTFFNYTISNSNGWANFTNLTSLFNVTVNGTDKGYNWTMREKVYVKPDNITAITVTLLETTLLVTVTNGSAYINGSNVTLINLTSGSIAFNGSGEGIYGLTDSNGEIRLRHLVKGRYNMTVNTTGFNFYDTIIDVDYGSNTETVVLNDLQPPWFQNHVRLPSSPNEGQAVNIHVEWLDNAALSIARLEITEGGSASNHSQVNLGGKGPYNSSFSLSSAWTDQRVGQTIQYRVYGKDLAGHWNVTPTYSFSIADVTDPSLTVNHTPSVPLGDEVVSVIATASDNVNVTEILLYVDYSLKKNCSSVGVASCSWTGGPYPVNSYHYYYAVAKDAAGNEVRSPASNETLVEQTTALSQARSWPGAAFDPSTKLNYVVGGRTSSQAWNAIDKYNGSDDIFNTPSDSITSGGRRGAAVVALSRSDNSNITIIGGFNDTDFLDEIVEYDPSTSATGVAITFSGSSISNRTGASAVFDDTDSGGSGNVYIFGGYNGTTGEYLRDIIEYNPNPSGKTLTQRSALFTTGRFATAAVKVPGTRKAYIIGGWNGTNVTEILEYDMSNPDTNPVVRAHLPEGRMGISAAYWNGKIYIFGGKANGTGTETYYDSIIEFTPSSPWTVTTMAKKFTTSGVCTPACTARGYTAATYDNYTGKIYVFGGQDSNGPVSEIFEYTPTTGHQFWVDPSPPQAYLTVYVRDTNGNPLQNVNVSIQGGSVSNDSLTSSSGDLTFGGHTVGEYAITSDGASLGYGINTTSLNISAGTNSLTINLPTTTLHVNVTDASLQPVNNANVTIYADTAGTTIALDATGSPVYGYTDSSGMVTFTRVLPCTSCNLTVSKQTYNPSWNTTTISITAGSNQTVHIDPQAGFFSGTYTLNFTVNNLDQYADSINITVRYNDTGAIFGSNTTIDGHAVIYNVPNDYFDFIINGSVAGFSDMVVPKVAVGKIIINNGSTDLNGAASISVVGTGTYYVRVIAGGYVTYDDLANGTARSGSYDSGIGGINGTINVPLNGSTNLTGYVYDSKFRTPTPGSLSYEPVGYATVSVYTSDCSNIQGNLLRYQATTGLNSTYSIPISPRQRLSPSSNQTFCVQVSAGAYQSSTSGDLYNLPGAYSANVGMQPNETVSGWVKNFQDNSNIAGATIDLLSDYCYDGSNTNCSAYQATTDSSGYFSMAAAPRTSVYSFLPFTMRITKVSYNQSTYAVASLPSTGNTYYLLPAGSAFMQVNVTGSDNLTGNIIITLDGNVMNSTTSGCSLSGNVLTCQINDGSHTLVMNGSMIGYEANTTSFTILTGQVKSFNVHLNTTRINVTLKTDSGSPITNATVSLEGTSFTNQTDSSGAVLFQKVTSGTYNVTFSGGSIGEIYFYNSSSSTSFTVTDAMAGTLTQVPFVLNDTSAQFNITNSSKLPIASLGFFVTNSRTGVTYPKSTNSAGISTFTNKPYGNYTMYFNETSSYLKGYIPQNFTFEMLPGEDSGTNNSFTCNLTDVQLHFNISNSTSDPISGANVTVKLNGTLASSGLGVDQNGTANSTGELLLHEAVPESYAGGTYTYDIGANASGYGIWTGLSLAVGLNGTFIGKTLSPLSVTVYVRDSSGSTLSSPGVNISLMTGNSVAINTTGSFLNATGVTDSVTFTHLYVNNYTINISSVSYFSQNDTIDLGAATNESSESNFTMVARTLTLNIFGTDGSYVTDEAEARVYNTTHDIALNTTGDQMHRNTTTGTLTFYGVDDGIYNVSVDSENYTTVQNWTFDTSTGVYEHNFTMTRRVFTVYINDTNGGAITELTGVRIYNSTEVETNITGDVMYQNTTTGMTVFRGIRDGTFNVSVVSENYTSQNWTLDTGTGPYEYTFHLARTGIGYFNVTVKDNTTNASISGATVTLHNLTDTVETGTTDSNGNVLLHTNISAYNESLYVNATYTDYDENSTGPYNITDGEVKNITLTISQTPSSPSPSPSPPPPSGGGGGYGGGGGGGCTEDWICSTWGPCINGSQIRTCRDDNSCGTVWDRPELTRSCTVTMSISVTEVYLNAGECASSTLSISNTGDSYLAKAETGEFTITGCCSVTPGQTSVSSISSGSSVDVNLQVCADRYAQKGDHEGQVEVRANGLTRRVALHVHVTKNYGEVLLERLNEAEDALSALDSSAFDTVQMGLYNMAKEQIELAKTYLSAGNYDGTEAALESAGDYISQIGSHVPQAMDLSWLIWLLAPMAVVGLIGFGGWWFIVRKRTRVYKYKPPRHYPATPVPQKIDRNFLLKELKALEKKVLGINANRLGATDRYHYEKAKHALERMEHHIMQDNILSARTLLNEAETSLRVLESRLLSFDIIKKSEGFKV